MATQGTSQFCGDSLFVSPDNLMIDHVLNGFQSGEQATTPYDAGHLHPQPQRSVSFTQHHGHQRPNSSLPMSSSEWSIPTQAHFRTTLPPTPISPFRPLPQLSGDEKTAFPCLGGPDNCWNKTLCPKHRQYPDAPKPHHPDFSQPSNPQPPPNPRRRSAPVESNVHQDQPLPTKLKRHSTVPEEHNLDLQPSRHHHRKNSRNSLSRGRVPHNLVERRYRDNLNNQIEALRLTLPSLKEATPCTDMTELEDTASPRMPSKAIIISTAATYIKDMETERSRLLDANKALQEQVYSLQKLLRCEELNVVQYLKAMRLTAGQLPTPS